MTTPSLAQNSYSPGFFDRVDQFVNTAVETVTGKYHQLERAAPKIIAIAKKLLPFALLLFSLIVRPLPTLIGLGIGLAFSNHLEPIISKVQDAILESFKKSNLFGKILIGAGAAAIGFALPLSVSSALGGITAAIHIKNTIQN